MTRCIRVVCLTITLGAFTGCTDQSAEIDSGSEAEPPVTTVIASPAWAVEVDSARALARGAIRAGTAGMAVAVFHEREPVWIEGFGYADVTGRRLVEPDRTRFRIYSVAKPMTAVAAARLMERGGLNPDAPIGEYVEAWPSRETPITAMHLANHTSGIRHYADEAEARSTRRCTAVEDALPIFAPDELLHEPGARESYSSWGYVLLSAVVESAAGISFMSAMERLVFEPAEMASPTLDDPMTDVDHRASVYEESGGRPATARAVDNTCKWGAGGLLATAPDVARFGAAMLGGALISPPTLQLFLRGTDVYRAQGVGVGGTAFLVLDQANALSIAVLTNTSGERASPAAQRTAETIHAVFSRTTP